MYCPKCGQELDSNNICANPSCPSNSNNAFSNNSNPNNQYNNGTNYQYSNQYNDEYSNNFSNQYEDHFGVTPNEMMDYIGDKNTEYYMEKWTRYQTNEKFVSWNWPAFFFNIIWFAYRKMYNWAGILFGISFLQAMIFKSSGLSSLVNLATMVFAGLFANQLYIKNCIKKITSIKYSLPNISMDDLSRRLRNNGGITWIPVILIICVYVVLFVLIVIATAALFSAANQFYY